MKWLYFLKNLFRRSEKKSLQEIADALLKDAILLESQMSIIFSEIQEEQKNITRRNISFRYVDSITVGSTICLSRRLEKFDFSEKS